MARLAQLAIGPQAALPASQSATPTHDARYTCTRPQCRSGEALRGKGGLLGVGRAAECLHKISICHRTRTGIYGILPMQLQPGLNQPLLGLCSFTYGEHFADTLTIGDDLTLPTRLALVKHQTLNTSLALRMHH